MSFPQIAQHKGYVKVNWTQVQRALTKAKAEARIDELKLRQASVAGKVRVNLEYMGGHIPLCSSCSGGDREYIPLYGLIFTFALSSLHLHVLVFQGHLPFHSRTKNFSCPHSRTKNFSCPQITVLQKELDALRELQNFLITISGY